MSNPASSAASKSLPFVRRSHPRSAVVATVQFRRESRSGPGALWSNRIRMYGFLKAVSDEIDDLLDLVSCDAPVPPDDVFDGGALRKTFKNDRDGQPGIPKYPCAVNPLRIRLHQWTVGPVDHTPTIRLRPFSALTVDLSSGCGPGMPGPYT